MEGGVSADDKTGIHSHIAHGHGVARLVNGGNIDGKALAFIQHRRGRRGDGRAQPAENAGQIRRGGRHGFGFRDRDLHFGDFVVFAAVGRCLSRFGIDGNGRFAGFFARDLAAAQADGGDVFVVGIKANHVCAVARRERRGERSRFADGKRQLAWRDGNVRGAQQHLERFGRNGLARVDALGRNLHLAGGDGLQFARGLADGGDVFVAGIPLDFCVGHLERVAVQGVDGGRRGRAAFERDFRRGQRRSGQLHAKCKCQHERDQMQTVFFQNNPSLISESRVI